MSEPLKLYVAVREDGFYKTGYNSASGTMVRDALMCSYLGAKDRLRTPNEVEKGKVVEVAVVEKEHYDSLKHSNELRMKKGVMDYVAPFFNLTGIKFYEVTSPYFALISAYSPSKALEIYKEQAYVDGGDENSVELKEVSQVHAIRTLAKTYFENTDTAISLEEAVNQVEEAVKDKYSGILSISLELV